MKGQEDWKWVKIENVGEIETGTTPSKKNTKYYGKIYPFFKPTDLNNGRNVRGAREYLSKEGLDKARFLPKGSTLITCIGATIGKTGMIQVDGASNQQINAVIPFSIFLPEFVYYQVIGPKFQEEIKANASATTLPIPNKSKFKELSFAVPPLPEQRAIVSKIEQLFSELDNGIANLKLAQEQLKVYRQAVLKKAFEGELTKKWREQKTDLPDAKNLLEQIRHEKEIVAKTSGKKTKSIKSQTKDELSELPRLPKRWLWVKFGEACDKVFDGTHFSPKNSSQGDYKYITAKNIKEGYLDLSDLSYVTKKDHCEIFSRCDVKKGDILYIKDGATTGRACLNPLNEEFSLLSSVGVFRVNEKFIFPKYIEHYLNAEVTRHQMLKNVAGVAITRLTLVKLNNSILILPPTEEQQVIVQEIETRLSVCDKIEQDIEVNLEKAEALRQSILKKAFEGKLLNERELAEVRKADDWEPAEVLLERMMVERSRK